MPRPIEALIHQDALAHNLAVARQHAQGARVFAVIKARAYGHGLPQVFPALRGADGLALLDLEEAQAARTLGWRGPILLLEGCFEPRDLELCSRLDLWHTIHCSAQIDALAAHKTRLPHRVFLKLNSGMNRLGFSSTAFRGAWARLDALPQVGEISLMTHFANADVPGGYEDALARFEAAAHDIPGERSVSNSAALLRHGPLGGDWVRPGIASYGSSPDHPDRSAAAWNLLPVMTLRSKLIATQTLEPGQSVGYGHAFTADRPMRIGVAACGYADGYPRVAPTGTPVLVEGHHSRTLGRVSMDMLTVDLTHLPQAHVGSEVTLWGQGPQGQVLSVDVVASAAGTLGYELICALAPRVPVRSVVSAQWQPWVDH
jgi:alanine racemase